MALNSMALRLQSARASTSELTAIAGGIPAQAFERGSPVNPRQSDGPIHWVSTIACEGSHQATDLAGHVEHFKTYFDHLTETPIDAEISVDLVIAVSGRPMGEMLTLDPDAIQLLAAAGCGIVLDVYNCDDSP